METIDGQTVYFEPSGIEPAPVSVVVDGITAMTLSTKNVTDLVEEALEAVKEADPVAHANWYANYTGIVIGVEADHG